MKPAEGEAATALEGSLRTQLKAATDEAAKWKAEAAKAKAEAAAKATSEPEAATDNTEAAAPAAADAA